jgi:tripartite-type tricarboxylate transporter receptor subunit TctC
MRANLRRSITIALVMAAISTLFAPMPSQAQSDYPTRTVKIVNPFGAGSAPDILVRALSSGLASGLGQQFIVENRVGGSGAVGTASVARGAGWLHAVVCAGAGALGAAAGAQRRRQL